MPNPLPRTLDCTVSFIDLINLTYFNFEYFLDERVGNLTIVQKDAATTKALASQLTLLVRFNYSNPPAFGSRIVSKVLNTPDLRQEWMESIHTMSSRILKMRQLLYNELVALKTPGSWTHITEQIGMFSYTGLNGQFKLSDSLDIL